jgi:hypothetical protein
MHHANDKSVWRIEPLSVPTEAHAADALEIVHGEVVRKVSLPRLDFSIYSAWVKLQPASDLAGLIVATGHDYQTVQSAVARLRAAGLLGDDDRGMPLGSALN